mmetsp:Transcript_16968/g.47602  ORF Transcript_16968/g.47602 Transcript_16968/m.47602 type:complete len:203 (-) Transcript_16968:807-1415(-)
MVLQIVCMPCNLDCHTATATKSSTAEIVQLSVARMECGWRDLVLFAIVVPCEHEEHPDVGAPKEREVSQPPNRGEYTKHDVYEHRDAAGVLVIVARDTQKVQLQALRELAEHDRRCPPSAAAHATPPHMDAIAQRVPPLTYRCIVAGCCCWTCAIDSSGSMAITMANVCNDHHFVVSSVRLLNLQWMWIGKIRCLIMMMRCC